MGNIKLRSPYIITRTISVSSLPSYASLELKLNGVTTAQYVVNKDFIQRGSNMDVSFNISDLCRDYLDITFDGTYISQKVGIVAEVDSYNTSGVLINSATFVHDGFDGWSEFSEGVNQEMPSLSLAQSNTTIYVPQNTSGVIPFFNSPTIITYSVFSPSATSKTVASTNITIERICEPKFSPIKVTFVNKYGALQDIWFDKKSIEELAIKRESFKRNLISPVGSYLTSEHSKSILSVIGNESITMNTGFVGEGMNEVIKELMLSEQVWATIGSSVYPMNVEETSHTYKTSLNDRLVNYTVKFSYAFDLINNIG